MNPLARYEAACRAVAAAKNVDAAKDLADRAEALRVYARQAGDFQMEIDACEIRIRAERQIGVLLAEQRARGELPVGGRPPKTGSAGNPVLPSLASMGIGKKMADRCRSYATWSPDAFEAELGRRRDDVLRDRKRVTLHLVVDDKAEIRARREIELAARVRALPAARFGVVLDDPEWRYLVHSRDTGLDRAADNHYPTSDLAAIQARSEEIAATIAAPDCAWFRWATVPFLAHAMRALEVGGFVYKTHWAWAKDRIGTGFWNRNKHEILLLAVRGDVPCPAFGQQWDSLIPAALGAHSAKPDAFLEMIESYFPHVPKIELNRRGAARPGWAAWGNEAETGDEVAA